MGREREREREREGLRGVLGRVVGGKCLVRVKVCVCWRWEIGFGRGEQRVSKTEAAGLGIVAASDCWDEQSKQQLVFFCYPSLP